MARNIANPGFGLESWTLYAVGLVLYLLRITAQVRRLGFKKLQTDDYIVTFGILWYTVLCVAFNEMNHGAGSNLMTPEEVAALTPEIKAQRVLGAKWVFVTEHAMLGTIWSMKVALLLLYARITSGLSNQRKLVKIVGCWVAVGFVADVLALYLACLPTSQYWAVPAANAQCSTYWYYQIVNAVFNISTDCFIFLLGLPPIFKAKLSPVQKAILIFVFGMGLFVIVAAIMRAIYCLVPALVSYIYMNWYFREASVAVYVTMLPAIWSLLREAFPRFRSFGSRSRSNHGKSASRFQSHALSSRRRWPSGSKLQSHTFKEDVGDVKELGKAGNATTTEIELDRATDDAVSGDDCSTTSIYGNVAEIRRDVTVTVEYDEDSKPAKHRSKEGDW